MRHSHKCIMSILIGLFVILIGGQHHVSIVIGDKQKNIFAFREMGNITSSTAIINDDEKVCSNKSFACYF